MSDFISLSPSGLAKDFDIENFGEKPIVSVEEKKDSISINYIFPGFTVGDNEQQVGDEAMPFKEVGISGAGFVSVSGRPLLPSLGRFVQIPPGCDYKVSTKKNRPVKIDDLLVTPAQENATDQADESGEFEFDRQAYQRDALYPKNIVEVGEEQNLDGYKVLPIHVCPLQYNAAKRQLVGYSNIEVTIELTQKEEDDAELNEFGFGDPESNLEGFGNLVLNPNRRIVERIPIARVPSGFVLKPRGPEFLIIYDDGLKDAALRLARWKNRKGLQTDTVPISTVGNTVAKIKSYIRKQRGFLLSRLRYVLLFGDVNSIRAEEVGGNTTDHYYFTKNDPSGSNDCLLPWVSGGRIPVSSLSDADSVVTQIIDFERNPPADPDYYLRMTFAAFFQDDYPQDGRADRAYMKTMESIRSHMVSQGFSVERVYVSSNPNPQKYKDGSNVPAAVKAAIMDGGDATNLLLSDTSEGQLVIGHRDHGGDSGWSHPSYTTGHLPSIVGHMPSIFYSINCLTGRFDNTTSDSFAEDLLERRGGAPSLIAATEVSGTWRNDSLIKALFDALWPGVIPTFPGSTASYAIKNHRLGDVLNYGKSYLLVAHGVNSGVKAHFEIYHVVGDPTLQLYTERPRTLVIKAEILRKKLYLRLNTLPKGTVLTVIHRGRVVKRSALGSTRMNLPVSELLLSTARPSTLRDYIEVCVSAPGFRYTRTRVKL
ncbi:MAG: hypothetical protein KQI62_03385 [Deltaproteobacteria bacterium]|nr:hypothetical protein [Deltaproteobacteria bacterium]